jgi:hypothetical protein
MNALRLGCKWIRCLEDMDKPKDSMEMDHSKMNHSKKRKAMS